jgi:hypothetical protein
MQNNNQGQIAGFLLTGLGVLFLIPRVLPWGGALDWPIFIIAPGLLLFATIFMNKESTAVLSIPASIITMVGGILYAQNLTNHYESWSYTWTLILVAIGLGQVLQGHLQQNLSLQSSGKRTLSTGLVFFTAFAAFFEIFIFQTWQHSLMGRYALPLGLIIAGIYIFSKPSESPIQQTRET